ncbi:MAG: helix-turn-helix transcriptional regulator [Clostridiales Family XIII bacterium]|nr:helix-turn-helix transcriptional regulator [Clostridiales Family XIII bacterium]
MGTAVDKSPTACYSEYERKSTVDIEDAMRRYDNIRDFLRDHVDGFQGVELSGYLQQIVKKKGISRADAIKAADISESFAYQIFSGDKHPSRDKLLALAIGLSMDAEECRRALKLAGHSELYLKNRRDAIIAFGLRKRLDIYEINDLLFQMDEPALTKME